MSPAQLKTQLATLSAEDRAELALYLIDSLDPESDPDAQDAWQVELKTRADQIRQGEASGKPAERVMDRLRKKHS